MGSTNTNVKCFPVTLRFALAQKLLKVSNKGPFTLRASVNVTATLPLKNRAGFDFASILGETLSVHTHILSPMDDTGDITLDQRYDDADVWCEWALISSRSHWWWSRFCPKHTNWVRIATE